jgi:RNA polymerase sigma-70 factor (ECF subfamily)
MDDGRHRFESLVLPHLDAAYRFAQWLSRSPSDAEDIVQEAVLRAFRGFDALRGTDAKGWLLAIVKNAMIATTPDPESTSIRRDEERTLERLMSALPEEQREVLVLREIEEMDYRQIATITNVPIGTVMSRLARARAALKARLLQGAKGHPHAVR